MQSFARERFGVSLINKMLQDLEARQDPGAPSKAPVYQDLHSVKAKSPGGSRRLLVVLLGVTAIAGAAYVAADRLLVKETPAPVATTSKKPTRVAANSTTVEPPIANTVATAAPTPVSSDPAPTPVPASVETKNEIVPTPAPTVAAPVVATVPPPVATVPPAPVDMKPVITKEVVSAPPPAPVIEPKAKKPATKPAEPLPTRSVEYVTTTAEEVAVVDKKPRPLSSEEQAEASYREAAKLLERGRADDALREVRQLLAAQPNHVKARELAAAILIQTGHTADAERLLEDGLRLVPRHYVFAQLLARMHIDRGADAKAITVLETAAPHAANDADFNSLLAAIYQRAGRHDEAAKAYQRVLAQRNSDGRAWLGLAISLEAMQQWTGATDAYKRARESGGLTPALVRHADNRLAALKDR